MEISSGGSRTMSLLSPRSVLMTVLSVLCVLMLVWMILEQDKMKLCPEPYALPRNLAAAEPRVIVIQQNSSAHAQTPPPLWDYNWDKRAPAKGEKVANLPTRTLVLVRHGQYHMDSGRLTDLGRQQANLTGRRLKELNVKADIIIHSTLIRAVETAQLVHTHLPHLRLVPDDYIREGGPIPPQPTISYWGLSDKTYHEDGPRMEAAFRRHFHRADPAQTQPSTQILVGHGNIFRFFMLRGLQLTREAWMRVFIAHASITVLHINGDGIVNMDKFGDCGHFPPNMITY